MSKKIRILPDQYICKQGDAASTAFLVITGSFAVEIDNKKVGSIGEGEIFGELSLILSEPRKASIKAIIPSEVVEIKKMHLKQFFYRQILNFIKQLRKYPKN